jgi:RNA polymerase sigma-70 factor (ECF subfamily)
VIRLLFFKCNPALCHRFDFFLNSQPGRLEECHNLLDLKAPNGCQSRGLLTAGTASDQDHPTELSPQTCGLANNLATDAELSEFLKNVEKKAFKRAYYHVRNEDAALDILQDSMIKLSTNYADKPIAELPLLFQRILSNTMLDWFRRQKTRNAIFSNLSDFNSPETEGDFDLLEVQNSNIEEPHCESAEKRVERFQTLDHIETAVMALPARQREAFLLRYWEELDVAETAAVMGCSEGSVKTHCSRAIQALHQTLGSQGIKP